MGGEIETLGAYLEMRVLLYDDDLVRLVHRAGEVLRGFAAGVGPAEDYDARLLTAFWTFRHSGNSQ